MEMTISVPAHLELELKETAQLLNVEPEALAAYFFARKVVHT